MFLGKIKFLSFSGLILLMSIILPTADVIALPLIFADLNIPQCNDTIAISQTVNTSIPEMPATKYVQERRIFMYGSGVLISYGLVSLGNNGITQLNYNTQSEVYKHYMPGTKLDDYTQYIPALMVYGLNAFGIKGANNFKDRTLIYGMSQLIAAGFTLPLKYTIGIERPDGSNNLSFPSGHAGTAFSSAQFFYREYRDESLLLSLAGYPFAIFTGVYRVVNDKHWVSDVVAGAGFGILSTELAYFLYPKLAKMMSKSKKMDTVIFPQYQQGAVGMGLLARF